VCWNVYALAFRDAGDLSLIPQGAFIDLRKLESINLENDEASAANVVMIEAI
jgi:hypothetical protein